MHPGKHLIYWPVALFSIQLCVHNRRSVAQPNSSFQCGYLVDRSKKQPIIMQLFLLSSVLTLCCYAWLALPPEWTQTSFPAVLAFGSGYGFAPRMPPTPPSCTPRPEGLICSCCGSSRPPYRASSIRFNTFGRSQECRLTLNILSRQALTSHL
jgi:hypothetical protein